MYRPWVARRACGTASVRDFVEAAADIVGMAIERDGEGVEAVGRDRGSGRIAVRVDPRFFRPAGVDLLVGDPTGPRERSGRVAMPGLDGLVASMVKADRRTLRDGRPLR